MTQKERIVNAAFTAWGDTHFTDTSLAQVSSRLGVTKQALYRHVHGKKELLGEMERQFARHLHAVIDAFETDATGSSLEYALRRYVELLFDFFSAHPYYYLYLTLHLVQFPGNQGPQFHAVRDRHERVLRELLSRAGIRDGERVRVAAHFLSMSGFLWMASCFWTEDGHRRDPDAREIADRRSLAVEIVLHGLFPNADRGLAFERIEGETAVSEDELPERNHILDAIATVVTEQGFEQATVEKIAERAGMSKSSLYFHFRNRAEMMASMLLPERARLIELVESRVARYADFGSRLYAFMVVTASYAARSHSILTALDWMRFHRIRVHLDDTPQQGPIHPFIAERVNGAAFPYPGLSELETVAYLHHLVIRPVLDRYVQNRHRDDTDEEGSIPETVVRSTRLLYPLVVGGLMEKEREG